MPRNPPQLRRIVTELINYYGPPRLPITTDPFELIVLENVAYLVSDERREQAFNLLRKHAGRRPHEIIASPDAALLQAARAGGMRPEERVSRLREIALIAISEFGDNLRTVLHLPLVGARKELQKFPGIGEPGAEKILLFTRSHPVLGLDSNGLRVLLRLGFGEEKKNYSASYRSVQEAIKDELNDDYE